MILYNKKHYNAIKGVNSMEKISIPRPEHPQPMFLEVMTDKGEDTRLLREYYKSIKNK